ncbi:MAG: hypothetical protein AAFW70_02010 [Cyanobacteria bacterium J06635_10]
MIEIKKCFECGANLEHRIQGRTQGSFCNQCNRWAVVTTYIPPIVRDKTKYKMYLCSADSNNKEHIKALSKIANVNFLQAKKMAQEHRPLILEYKALEIDKACCIFNNLSIKYDIEPLFPY